MDNVMRNLVTYQFLKDAYEERLFTSIQQMSAAAQTYNQVQEKGLGELMSAEAREKLVESDLDKIGEQMVDDIAHVMIGAYEYTRSMHTLLSNAKEDGYSDNLPHPRETQDFERMVDALNIDSGDELKEAMRLKMDEADSLGQHVLVVYLVGSAHGIVVSEQQYKEIMAKVSAYNDNNMQSVAESCVKMLHTVKTLETLLGDDASAFQKRIEEHITKSASLAKSTRSFSEIMDDIDQSFNDGNDGTIH